MYCNDRTDSTWGSSTMKDPSDMPDACYAFRYLKKRLISYVHKHISYYFTIEIPHFDHSHTTRSSFFVAELHVLSKRLVRTVQCNISKSICTVCSSFIFQSHRLQHGMYPCASLYFSVCRSVASQGFASVESIPIHFHKNMWAIQQQLKGQLCSSIRFHNNGKCQRV